MIYPIAILKWIEYFSCIYSKVKCIEEGNFTIEIFQVHLKFVSVEPAI